MLAQLLQSAEQHAERLHPAGRSTSRRRRLPPCPRLRPPARRSAATGQQFGLHHPIQARRPLGVGDCLLLHQPRIRRGTLLAHARIQAECCETSKELTPDLVSHQAFLEVAQHAQFTGLDAGEFAQHMRAQGLPATTSESAQDGFSDAAPTTPVAMPLNGRIYPSPPTAPPVQQPAPPQGGRAAALAGMLSPLMALGNAFAMTSTESPQLLPSTAPVAMSRAAAPAGSSVSNARNSITAAPMASAPANGPASGQQVVTRWTVDELAAVGAALLASEGDDGPMISDMARKYRFLNREAAELQLGEVPRVLGDYTELVQRYEALLRGVTLMLESSAGAGPGRPTEPQTAAPATEAANMFSGLNIGSGGGGGTSLAGSAASLDTLRFGQEEEKSESNSLMDQ